MKTIVCDYSGKERLDVFISKNLNISRNIAQNMVRKGLIKINGKIGKSNNILVPDDVIVIDETPASIERKKAPNVGVMFINEDMIAVNKEAGIVVYPSYGHESGTLLDAIRDKIDITQNYRSGVVHRLDKDTSGVIIFARNVSTEVSLKKLFATRKVSKKYIALLSGNIVPIKGRVEIPIARSSKNRRKMSSSYGGRNAISAYRVIEYIGDKSLVEIQILTGRTHQIRAHFASIGFPVVGDTVYGPKKHKPQPLKRFFLHSHSLGFTLNRKKFLFVSPLAPELKEHLNTIRLEHNIKK